MADSFNCLRHNAIIGSHDQNHNIGHFGTARAHFRKGLVTRRINKGNLVTFRRHNLICTDMLGNTAGFACGNVCLAQGIQQRSLTMVNVPHNRNHRCPRQHLIRRIFRTLDSFFNIAVGHALKLVSQFFDHDLRRIGINRLVNGCHNPQRH